MKFEELTGCLSEEQKKRLKEVKTEEELNSIRLSDNLLEGVSGGKSDWDEDCRKFGCFQPRLDDDYEHTDDDKYFIN